MTELSTYGMRELDATEMVGVCGGDGLPLKAVPDDALDWLIEKICGPIKQDPTVEMRQSVP